MQDEVEHGAVRRIGHELDARQIAQRVREREGVLAVRGAFAASGARRLASADAACGHIEYSVPPWR